MTDMDSRQAAMQQDVLLVVTAGLSLLNGMHFSPYFEPAFLLARPFIAGTPLATPILSLYLTSLFIAVMTLLIAGVPAAIFERLRGQSESTPASLGIWLVGTLLLAAPSLLAALGIR